MNSAWSRARGNNCTARVEFPNLQCHHSKDLLRHTVSPWRSINCPRLPAELSGTPILQHSKRQVWSHAVVIQHHFSSTR